jgi:hypothetical protein
VREVVLEFGDLSVELRPLNARESLLAEEESEEKHSKAPNVNSPIEFGLLTIASHHLIRQVAWSPDALEILSHLLFLNGESKVREHDLQAAM